MRLIDLDAFWQYVRSHKINFGKYQHDLLNRQPTVQVMLLKQGHWIRWYEQKENDRCIEHIPHCKCSECGKEYDPHSSQFIKFCSNCGAKMSEIPID